MAAAAAAAACAQGTSAAPSPAPAAGPTPDSLVVAVATPNETGDTLRPATGAPRLVVRRIPPSSARDALDAGVDILITRDPETIAYAATRSDLRSVPLPWDRTYLLLQPHPLVDSTTPPADSATHAARAALAADAVRVEARAAANALRWAAHLAACTGPRAIDLLSPAAPPAPRIVYAADDAVAGALAARLVALAGRGDHALRALAPGLDGLPLRAAALSPAALVSALRVGDDAAYVVALPSPADPSSCAAAAALIHGAPWLAADSAALSAQAAPLIDTRAHAIVRRGLPGIVVDSSGEVRAPAAERGAP